MTLLSVSNLSVSLRGRSALRDVTFAIGGGELVGLIGPNGAGKTTLMRAAQGLVGAEGHSSLAALAAHARAKAAAWVPQTREIAWPVTVETVVMLGRIPHLAAGQSPTEEDRRHVDGALAATGLDCFRNRTATRLSGGEQARVLIARALAQDTPLILADEPISGLDPANQIATLKTFAGLAAAGRSVLVSLHDLGLAVRHCSRLILLEDGYIVADGTPGEVLTPERLTEVFNIRAFYEQTPVGPVYQALEVVE